MLDIKNQLYKILKWIEHLAHLYFKKPYICGLLQKYMTQNTKLDKTKILLDTIIEGIERKKGLEIVKIDLQPINHSECDYFVVCHGNSNTQVNAIANSVEDTVMETLKENPIRKDGYKNSIWIVLDYVNIMVHIFQHDTRKFYDIENLWADADIEEIKTEY